MATVLNTDRLQLHTLNASHVNLVLEYFTRNRDFFRPWFPTYHTDFFTQQFQQSRLEKDWKEMKEGKQYRFYIFSKKDKQNKHILGSITCSNIVRGPLQSCFLGYMVDRRAQNKGVATEALARIIRFAFEDLQLHRVEANIMPRNLASIRVVQKLNFIREGMSEKYLRINGKWEDHLRFALLNE